MVYEKSTGRYRNNEKENYKDIRNIKGVFIYYVETSTVSFRYKDIQSAHVCRTGLVSNAKCNSLTFVLESFLIVWTIVNIGNEVYS